MNDLRVATLLTGMHTVVYRVVSNGGLMMPRCCLKMRRPRDSSHVRHKQAV